MVGKKPSGKFLKLNVDATFNVDDISDAASAIIRDTQGNFGTTSSKYIPHVPSTSAAQNLCNVTWLELANLIGSIAIETESDCL